MRIEYGHKTESGNPDEMVLPPDRRNRIQGSRNEMAWGRCVRGLRDSTPGRPAATLGVPDIPAGEADVVEVNADALCSFERPSCNRARAPILARVPLHNHARDVLQLC